ncbi:MAG TPA: hypothetical protein DC049_05195 [Spirochaetia bacterium]|nr:hypothetical protein [Spirochaetia bacterium]
MKNSHKLFLMTLLFNAIVFAETNELESRIGGLRKIQTMDEYVKEIRGIKEELLRLEKDDPLKAYEIGETILFLLFPLHNYAYLLEVSERMLNSAYEDKSVPYYLQAIVYSSLNEDEKALEIIKQGSSLDKGKFTKYLTGLEKNIQRKITRNQAELTIAKGKAAPLFELSLMDGKEFSLENKKNKFILIDFWATWCAPCKKEIPNLERVFNETEREKLEIIGISLDQKKDVLKQYLSENNIPWNIAFLEGGFNSELAGQYGVTGIPKIILINPNGEIVHANLRGEEMVEIVKDAIAEFSDGKK